MIEDDTGEWTGIQIATARKRLERKAEMLLGRFLFSYARLESALDLCLVWVDQGIDLEKRTCKIERLNFAAKLDLLGSLVQRSESSRAKSVYKDWLRRVHRVRERRNALVHGRLGIDVRRDAMIAVLSRATSAMYKSVEFRLDDLDVLIVETRALNVELDNLRVKYPLTS